ncbi:MAG: hypothetical protein JO187_10815 [Acidobacteria bacterium]|nr:hypothetical protein [Acidobacteriota bacterium]
MRTLSIVIALTLILSLSGLSQENPVETGGQTVTVSGCVEKGVENGCLVLRDTKTRQLYDLQFTGAKAAPGDRITFDTITRPGETSVCRQGKVAHVGEWTKIKNCVKPPAASGF